MRHSFTPLPSQTPQLLGEVAAAFPKVASVVGAVCGVLGAVLTAADTEGEGAALVPTVLEQLGALQEQLPTAACVDAVVTALERYATLPAVVASRRCPPPCTVPPRLL